LAERSLGSACVRPAAGVEISSVVGLIHVESDGFSVKCCLMYMLLDFGKLFDGWYEARFVIIRLHTFKLVDKFCYVWRMKLVDNGLAKCLVRYVIV